MISRILFRIGRRIDLDVIVNRRQFAQQRLGDLAIGRNDDFAGLRVDHVERNFFAEQDVARAHRSVARVSSSFFFRLSSVIALSWRFVSAGVSFSRETSWREETFTSITMP